jgi:hypothetical protein
MHGEANSVASTKYKCCIMVWLPQASAQRVVCMRRWRAWRRVQAGRSCTAATQMPCSTASRCRCASWAKTLICTLHCSLHEIAGKTESTNINSRSRISHQCNVRHLQEQPGEQQYWLHQGAYAAQQGEQASFAAGSPSYQAHADIAEAAYRGQVIAEADQYLPQHPEQGCVRA